MKVSDLITRLQQLLPDADVVCLWDGEPRSEVEHAYLARDGYVVLADFDEVCYSTGARPADAPTEEENPYWKTPKSPELKVQDAVLAAIRLVIESAAATDLPIEGMCRWPTTAGIELVKASDLFDALASAYDPANPDWLSQVRLPEKAIAPARELPDA